jgi:hypothetical protein
MQSRAALIKFVKTKKNKIYCNVPNRIIGPIHALCLQLVATGILELGISDKNKNLISKTDLTPKSVIVKLRIVNGEPSILLDNYFSHAGTSLHTPQSLITSAFTQLQLLHHTALSSAKISTLPLCYTPLV